MFLLKKIIRQQFLIVAFFCPFLLAKAQVNPDQDALLQIMKKELNRNMTVLKEKKEPVYLLSYRIENIDEYQISTSFGNQVYLDSSSQRILTIQVRLGNYQLDNFHELRGSANFSYQRMVKIPLSEDNKGIEQILWRETDLAYTEAIKRYEKVKANVAVKVEADDKSPDYSDAPVSTYYEAPIAKVNLNMQEWNRRLKAYSALFKEDKEILRAGANFSFSCHRKYFVNSEGTAIVQNQTYTHLYVNAMTQAEDGMELPLLNSYFAHFPNELPAHQMILEESEMLKKRVLALRNAPVVEPYSGPALLSNEAAGVFFHEIFGHRVEGLRMKSERDGQTFKKKLGEEVLNPDISIVFEPQIKYYRNIPLNGSYVYDDEGVKGERVVIVDQGILKNFLMTRTPIDSFPRSNGHARAQAGYQPVSRQSNLIVETKNPYTDAQLREMLIEEAKNQGKTYGYLFNKVQGGFTMTGRYTPNSFNVTPLEVWRIYVDGRPDELVRGVDLVGTPLSMFSQIEAVGEQHRNFAGTCGAESGRIPAACCSPSLFVKRIEVQKKSKSQNRPPLIDRNTSSKDEGGLFEEIAFRAMEDEMKRNLENLKIEGLKDPYYISYLITDAKYQVVESTLGGVVYSAENPYRNQETMVLVGDNKNNNLNFADENSIYSMGGNASLLLPDENDYTAIRNSLWRSTDAQYKKAAEQFEAKKVAIQQQNLSEEIIELPDFAEIEKAEHNLGTIQDSIQFEDLQKMSVELSKLFLQYPHFTNSKVSLYAYQANALYLNSEEQKYIQPFSLICLRVFAETIAEDGESLMNYFNLYFTHSSQIPGLDKLSEKVLAMADVLDKLRTAPVLKEAYSGPVMFINEAVGEIVARSFVSQEKGGLLAGRKSIVSNPGILRSGSSRIPQENSIENMKGKKVISRNLTVTALDRKTTYDNIPLIGAYQVDAEGVIAPPKLTLIDQGVLQTLLTDRIPTPQYRSSNGHKRLALSGPKLTTSLSAGVIEMTGKDKLSYDKIKKQLIAKAKEEDYEYAYIIPKLVEPGTFIPGSDKYANKDGRYVPVYVIRVDVKSGEETIMRSARVSALNMKSFKYVEAISNRQQVYNTMLKGKNKTIWGSYDFMLSGAPTTFILPTAILFRELEVEPDPNLVLRKLPEVQSPLIVD